MPLACAVVKKQPAEEVRQITAFRFLPFTTERSKSDVLEDLHSLQRLL
jgi:hypothetical protein